MLTALAMSAMTFVASANPPISIAEPATTAAAVPAVQPGKGYTNTVLVASDASYQPLVMVDPLLQNGWGVAIRPPGAGGHFWISNFNTGTTTTYVGDVHDKNGKFTPLFQDDVKVVHIPPGSGRRPDGRPTAAVSQPTGQVFNHSPHDFIVTGEGITGPSKFIFVTGEGTISGWVELKDPVTGEIKRQTRSVIMVDQSQEFDDDRLRFTGCAITDLPRGNRLYVTNWITDEVEVYDHTFRRMTLPKGRFRCPDQPEGFLAWNIQYFKTGPNNEGRLWVAFALREEPWEEDPGYGAVAEFDLDGNFIRRFQTSLDVNRYADSELRAPWGLAIAPDNFGPLSKSMLVANFGDGSIAAYNMADGRFIDFIRDDAGEPILVDGVWGLTFGNGVALGDSDAMYYAAGPNNEVDGTFGTIRYTKSITPKIATQPAATTSICLRQTATLKIAAPAPVRLAMQWQARQDDAGAWINVADGPLQFGERSLGVVNGATTDSLSFKFSQSELRRLQFRCVVRGGGESASDLAEVVLLPGDDDACKDEISADR